MGQNYNLNSAFGLNVTSRNVKKPATQLKTDINNTIGNFLNSMTSYVSENEKVLDGSVANEIGMYTRQSMLIGLNLRAAEDKHLFDING